MNKQLLLHKLITEELQRYEALHNRLEHKMTILPKGSLLDRNGHIYRAYRENGRQFQTPLQYDSKLYNDLLLRRYIKEGFPILQKRAKLCKDFLKNEVYYDLEQIRNNLPTVYHDEISSLLFLKGDFDITGWQNAPYKRNPAQFSEKHFTAGGVQVRSKSEAMIGSQMESRKRIFRCEPEIWCGNQCYYPDFEVLMFYTRTTAYLEHFGKMDDPEYLIRKKAKRLP